MTKWKNETHSHITTSIQKYVTCLPYSLSEGHTGYDVQTLFANWRLKKLMIQENHWEKFIHLDFNIFNIFFIKSESWDFLMPVLGFCMNILINTYFKINI